MKNDVTLKQGLALFYAKNKQYFAKLGGSESGSEFLKHHDIAHVVFGCDTSLHGEGIVKIWTSFGTTWSFWKIVNGYRTARALHLSSKYSAIHILRNIFPLLLVIPKVLVGIRRMKKPWPFNDYEKYLNQPLSMIRKEFNIEIINNKT